VSKIEPSKLIFLDEAGANLSMCRTHGRAKGKARLVCANPYGRGNKFSMISAVSQEKVLAALYGEGSVDGVFFTHFIESYLVPALQPGDYLIMDNVSFHKVKAVEMIVENTGAKIVYLPPYSPELSPIELMWSKLKTILRK
jgi:transposase